MAKKSRPQLWAEAVKRAQDAMTKLEAARDEVRDAIERIKEVQDEYQMWYDNFPENAQGSETYQKLEAVVDLDLEPDEDDIDAMRSAIEEAEGMDLPLGFGRD